MHNVKANNPIIRFSALQSLIPVSRSTIDRWEKSDLFPKRISLGRNSVGWSLQSIEKWLSDKNNAQL